MVLSGLWAFLATRDAPQIVRPAEPFDLRAEYRALRENRPFLILWTTFLFQNFAIGASATTLIYLVIFVMKIDAALVGAMVATSAVGAMVATPFWVRLAQYGKQKAYAAGIVGAATLSLLMLFMPAGLPAALFVALFLIGLVDGGTQLCPNAMVPDTVEYDEERTGQRREGTIFGTWLLCRQLGMAMGAFIASLFLSAFGFVAGADAAAQGENALLGIRLSYTLVPCVLWVCAFFVLRAYPLTEARFEELKRNISAARASKETA
jgi:glycoside/pentoside/hexuronide:cation symporter, GPH family